MEYGQTKKALQSLELYAADWQEPEMQMVPYHLIKNKCIHAAISVNYLQKRSLLLLTNQRILVFHAQSQPSLVLELPLADIECISPCAWYGTGNVTCFSKDDKYFFSLMSPTIFVPFAERIETLAKLQRKN